ncbi:hypothetical protein A9B99_09060 [Mangrovibacter phragmitis]|uniref:Adhesin n=1 Tax=Mangrovibacter phragmitis TaxID=1691903 RepID=A0A1B7L258_9ENTR|nr:hypothetical protein [Mangrovibacter phragmitis]OAT76452.1 hypothetical protein A9B99_09060 [Mangrovibacter phragmitis]
MGPSEHPMKYLLIAILAFSNSFSAIAATLQCTAKGWSAGRNHTSYHTSQYWDEIITKNIKLTLLRDNINFLTGAEVMWSVGNDKTMLYYKYALTGKEDQATLLTTSGNVVYCTGGTYDRCDIGRSTIPQSYGRRYNVDFTIKKDITGDLKIKVSADDGRVDEYFVLNAPDIINIGDAVSIPDTLEFTASNDKDSLLSQKVLEKNNGPGSITIRPSGGFNDWYTDAAKSVFIYPSSTANSSTVPSSTTYTNKVGEPIYINLKVNKGATSAAHSQRLTITLNCP